MSSRSGWGDDDDKVRRGASVSYRSPVHCQTLLGVWSDRARPPLVLTVAVAVDASKCVSWRVVLGESGQQDGEGDGGVTICEERPEERPLLFMIPFSTPSSFDRLLHLQFSSYAFQTSCEYASVTNPSAYVQDHVHAQPKLR